MRSSQQRRVNLKGDTAEDEKEVHKLSAFFFDPLEEEFPHSPSLCVIKGSRGPLWSNIDFICSHPFPSVVAFLKLFRLLLRHERSAWAKALHKGRLKQHLVHFRCPCIVALVSGCSQDQGFWCSKKDESTYRQGTFLDSTSFFSPPILSGHVKLLPAHPVRIQASVEEKDGRDEHQVNTGHPQTHVLVL